MTRIALQMYTVRKYGANLDEQLEMVREAGFKHVEMSLSEGLEATIKLLDKHGIVPISSGVGLDSWDDKAGVENNFAFLKHYKARGSMNGFYHSDAEGDWVTAAKKLEEMAQEFVQNGFVLEYHNHDHEYRLNFGGKNALDILFANAPTLKYQMDIGWVTAGGADPVAMIDRYSRPLSSIHVKDLPGDYARGSGDTMPELGQGETPIPAAVAKAVKMGVTDFIIENDEPADIPAFCKRAHSYLSDLLK